jgi:hypothetical protein
LAKNELEARIDATPKTLYDLRMLKRSSKQKDPSEIARHVLDVVVPDAESKPEKNPAAVALGRLGGKKGGLARAAKLTSRQRTDIARKAAQSRWKKV